MFVLCVKISNFGSNTVKFANGGLWLLTGLFFFSFQMSIGEFSRSIAFFGGGYLGGGCDAPIVRKRPVSSSIPHVGKKETIRRRDQ